MRRRHFFTVLNGSLTKFINTAFEALENKKMFGIYRTALALIVVVGHLHGPLQMGTFAVFGFYILSGYLMTTIMHQSYGYTVAGRKRFALNRALRLFPSYWAAIIFSIVLLYTLGSSVTDYKEMISMPSNAIEWIKNILIMFPLRLEPRLSPATWAITVEIAFYVLICLGLSKSKLGTRWWFLLSLVYTVGCGLFFSDSWELRYFSIFAASLPFSAGAMLYHYRELIIEWVVRNKMNKPLLWVMLILVNFLVFTAMDHALGTSLSFTVAFNINMLFMFGCIVSLLNQPFPLTNRKIDSMIGKLSFPVYLIHWQVGALVHILIWKEKAHPAGSPSGVSFVLLSVVITVVISCLFVLLIDDPIEKFRKKIKQRAADSA